MPCQGGCNSVVYICGCKKCAKIRGKRKKWWDDNNAMKKRLKPEYLKKARKAMGDIDGEIIFISDEEGKLEMEVFGEYGTWVDKLGDWLERCEPFPEEMTFEKMFVKKAPVLYTTHKHTDVPGDSECDECPACKD